MPNPSASLDPPACPFLIVEDLIVRFPERYGEVAVLDSVSLELQPGETLAVVGESGCGKSLLGLTIMGLAPESAEVSGSILLPGAGATTSKRSIREGARNEVSMIYQDPLSALNPGMTVGRQLRQVMSEDADLAAAELFELVQLHPPHRFLKAYPHELSGGQRQRVVIAMAISSQPSILIADEPTTALDVTVEAQVVALLKHLQETLGFAMIFISHDLALVAGVADRIAVMYAGQVVEVGATDQILHQPTHHYTLGLLSATASLERLDQRLAQVKGVVPTPQEFSPACRFNDRCSASTQVCRDERPRLVAVSEDVQVACHHPIDIGGEGT